MTSNKKQQSSHPSHDVDLVHLHFVKEKDKNQKPENRKQKTENRKTEKQKKKKKKSDDQKR